MIVSKLETGSPIDSPALQQQKLSKMLGLILFVAVASRVWGVWFGYPNILHPDEPLIVQGALKMLQAPEYDLNPHFFEYPSLYFYLTALLFLLTGIVLKLGGVLGNLNELYQYAQQHLFLFHLLGRLLTAGFGVATIFLAHRTVRNLYGRTTALLAAWFLTLSYLHFTDSHYISTDVPSAFFVVWAFHLASVALQRQRLKTLVLAAFVSGLAAAVKYPTGLVFGSVLTAAFALCRQAHAVWHKIFFTKYFLKLAVFAGLGFLAGTPYAVLDFKAFAGGLLSQLLHSGVGHLGVEESGFLGYFTALVPSGGMGVALMIAACGGLLLSMWRPQTREVLLFSFPILFYLLLGRSALKVDRYLIPAIPFLCMYAAIFVERFAALLQSRVRLHWALAVFVLLLSVQPGYNLMKWCWIATQPDVRNEAAQWLDHNIGPEIMIATRVGSWQFPPLHETGRKLKQLKMFTEESTRMRMAFKLELLQQPVTAWIMREVFKDTTCVEGLRQGLERFPSFAEWRAPTLRELRAEGVQVMITSSLLEARFYEPTTQKKFPEMTKSWQELFESLPREGRLLKEFVPPASMQHPWGLGFLEQPVIRIYAFD